MSKALLKLIKANPKQFKEYRRFIYDTILEHQSKQSAGNK